MLRALAESFADTFAFLDLKRAPTSLWHRLPSGRSGSWGWIQEASAGGWQRNEEISIEAGLANPTLYACVTLIAGDVAKLRLKLVEQNADRIWNEVESSAFSPFIRKPNHYQHPIDFYEWWMISKLTTGNTYAIKARDKRGMVVAAHILDPTRVTVLVAPDGSVFYDLDTDDLAGIGPVVVPAREMFHDVMCPLFHPLCGVSPLYAAGAAALLGLTIRTQSEAFFSNGSKPGGVILAPGDTSQESAQRYADHWNTNYSGDNAGKIAVLGGGLTYQPIAVTAEQADLVKQLGFTDEDIAKVYLVPRYKVGIGPDPSTDNTEALTIQYHGQCIQKHLEKLELCLDYGLELTEVPGRTLGVEFERDDLWQMDTATLVKTAREAIQGGASPNEVRYRWLGLGPIDGGEVPFLQQQMWPINQLAQREIPTGAPTPPPAPPIVEEIPAAAEEEQKALPAFDPLDRARARLYQKRIAEGVN